MATNIHNTCLICDCENLFPLKEYQSSFLVKCANCSFVFAHKIPSTEELVACYDTYPTLTISPITIKRYNELLDGFEKKKRTNNILDLGCGQGFFIETAKKRGWNVYGTEYRKQAIETCLAKGLNIHSGGLNDSPYPNNFFDIITSFEVIEHINNPVLELEKIHQLLVSDGYLYATTPNFNSLNRIFLGKNWCIIGFPDHLSYYTPKTINHLFTKSKFNKVSLKTTGFSYASIKNELKNSQAATRILDEQFRAKTEKSTFMAIAKQVVNAFLTLFGTGDTIKALYKKNS